MCFTFTHKLCTCTLEPKYNSLYIYNVNYFKLSALSIPWSDNSPYGFLIKAFGQQGPGTEAQTDR